ncbi:MAG: NAD+ synthase [Chloroflexi bacterium]|nr:NAD+ synthase [Chloroflexota bacterium]
MRILRLGLAQINSTVGDLKGNTARIKKCMDQARQLGVDLLSFPELAVTGYPPEDLLFKAEFVRDNMACLQEIVEYSAGIAVVVGFVDAQEDLYNAAAVMYDGKLYGKYHKMYLPNYGVFDEERYFRRGGQSAVYNLYGVGIGVNICEDIWYPIGPIPYQVHAGAELIVNIDASPYDAHKRQQRERLLYTRANDHRVFISYNNLVGGQDELVFDGQSMVVNELGEIVAQGKAFAEDLIVTDLDIDRVTRVRLHDPRLRQEKLSAEDALPLRIAIASSRTTDNKPPLPQRSVRSLDKVAEVYAALVLGTRDYVRKNGFKKVVIGLSGGIDSALVAVIAVEALGPENVTGVSMPSMFSSEGSMNDAQLLARNLGIELLTIPIRDTYELYLKTLDPAFAGTKAGVAEENLQARVRGNLLMALSNKFGWLVLSTGNKSEMATGYATLYGDMAGGFAVIKDVPKTLVYQVAGYVNNRTGKDLIPQATIDKPPSAELRPDQKDTDSLPPYDVLDPILQAYVEEDRSASDIEGMGYDAETVRRVIRMVDRNEYKRRQAAPGVKITPRAFGRDRRLPITNRYSSG